MGRRNQRSQLNWPHHSRRNKTFRKGLWLTKSSTRRRHGLAAIHSMMPVRRALHGVATLHRLLRRDRSAINCVCDQTASQDRDDTLSDQAHPVQATALQLTWSSGKAFIAADVLDILLKCQFFNGLPDEMRETGTILPSGIVHAAREMPSQAPDCTGSQAANPAGKCKPCLGAPSC